jgi:NADH dehydrogenase (ubiquinone) Fe-S protein 1
MLKIYVNNLKVFVQPNTTVLEACETIGIEIPRFCYYEKLSIAGNCRMCLVEIEKSPKPVVSCAMPVMGGMKIFTNTPLVKKAREGVLEFLLLNHPLDCPICDQGGECDLQDQATTFGTDRSRFYDFKRGVEDKNVGPLIKTIMTRCIHCTRCVRFAAEIAGIGDLGTTARGLSVEIGTYSEKVFQSELSGNIVDLCPVGALTSKSYAFVARPWELKTVSSIDISDAIGSNIRIDFKETEIVRILPRANEEINEEWISNKTRFMYDGLKRQRLISPYIKPVNTLIASNWMDSLSIIKIILESGVLYNKNIIGICGANNDLETLLSFKNFIHSLGSESVGFERNLMTNNTFSFNYMFNNAFTGIEKCDFCLLIGVNPRYEGSLLNIKLRKRFVEGGFKVVSVGTPVNLTYPTTHIGLGVNQLYNTFFNNEVNLINKAFFEAKNPIIIFGSSILERKDSLELQKLFSCLNSNVNYKSSISLNLLQSESNQTGAFELGLNKVDNDNFKCAQIIYLVGVDNYTANEWLQLCNKDCFVIYQGSNGTPLTKFVDVVLPSSAFTEKKGTFINTEGRLQQTFRVLIAPGLAKDDWKIFKALSKIIGVNLKFNQFEELRNMLSTLIPSINTPNKTIVSNALFVKTSENLHTDKNFKYTNGINKTRFQSLIEDFYLTSSTTKASYTLTQCSISLKKEATNFTVLS